MPNSCRLRLLVCALQGAREGVPSRFQRATPAPHASGERWSGLVVGEEVGRGTLLPPLVIGDLLRSGSLHDTGTADYFWAGAGGCHVGARAPTADARADCRHIRRHVPRCGARRRRCACVKNEGGALSTASFCARPLQGSTSLGSLHQVHVSGAIAHRWSQFDGAPYDPLTQHQQLVYSQLTNP